MKNTGRNWDSAEISRQSGCFKSKKNAEYNAGVNPKGRRNRVMDSGSSGSIEDENMNGEHEGFIWETETSEASECFKNRDAKASGMDETYPDRLAGSEIQKRENENVQEEQSAWETEVHIAADFFKSRNAKIPECSVSALQKEESVDKPPAKSRIKDIIGMLVRETAFISINGKELYMKEGGNYIWISLSPESEIMHLKAFLRQCSVALSMTDYKTVILELKTEPDIWVSSMEQNKDGQYNISFCGGRRLLGVEGRFDDFAVSGQIQNRLKPFTEGIQMFISECCKINRDERISSSALFCAYKDFMNEYPEYLAARQNQFVPYIKKMYGLYGGSNGRNRVIIGISLIETC